MAETFPQAFGRYQLRERLALGGMAELFLAQVAGAHGFEKTVVIKRILPHLAADEQFTAMFISEAKITAQLAHPKIAQTFELGTENKQLFIVMEYIDGVDVLALLRECAHRRVRVPAEVSVYILKEVLDALDFAHKLRDSKGDHFGIVHRDVSPSNILLSKRGDVKLVDFGIAHAADQDGHTRSGTLKGKYGYMSPEQVLGQGVSAKSDVFAAGVVLAEMLMGRRLFAAANELDVLLMVRDVDLQRLDKFGGHIEDHLASLLRWALRKDPGDRYQDAGVFRDSLDEWLFEQRHRITAANLADIVNSLYDDALARRKEGLERAEPSAPPDAATATPFSAAGSNKLELGVPTGLTFRPPEDEASAIIEVSLEEDGALSLGETPAVAAAIAAAVLPASDDEIISFHDAESPDIDLALELHNPALETESGSVEIDFSSLNEAEEQVRRDTASTPPSYDSISAAVASVSPLAPDPASMDFDDSDISGGQEGKVQRRMGTADGLATSAPPSPPTFERSEEEAAREGEIGSPAALGVLYRTTAARESGKIALASGGVIKEIYFKRGVPEFVSSNVASELFGAYLVRVEVISSGELDMALAVMPHFGGKLGDTLVGLGLMKPLEVFRHLTRQVRSKLIEVCTWTTGRYEWFPNVKCPKQAFPLDLDPLEVYGAGAMSMVQADLKAWSQNVGEVRPIAARSSVAVPELFQVAGIRRYQESLDGTRSINELMANVSQGGEGLHELRLLFLLMNTNLLVDANAEDSAKL